MKKQSIKKAISTFMTGAIMLGFVGCFDFGAKKAVLAAAEQFASDVVSADASALIKNSTLDKKSSEATDLEDLLDDSKLTDDQKAFCEAVAKSIEYEIDEESLEVKKGEASIDIVFNIADYEKVLEDKFTKIDDLTAAIKKASTKEIRFTAEFVKEDKEWVCDNVASKKFMKLYDYRTANVKLTLTPDMIKAFIDTNMSGFWLEKDGKLTDLSYIEYNYYFNNEILGYKDLGIQLYYVLSKDGKQVYTSSTSVFGETTNLKCKVTEEDLGLKKNTYLEKGDYKIDLYMKTDEGDQLIDSVSIKVEQSQKTTTGNKMSGEGDFYNFKSAQFRSQVIIAGWLNTDNAKVDAKTFNTNVKTLAFTFQVNETCTQSVDYKFFYTDKEDTASLEKALKNPIYSGTASPKKFTNGTFIDLPYPINGTAKVGTYLFMVYEPGTNNVLALGFCRVKQA